METSLQMCGSFFIRRLRYPPTVYINRCLEAAVNVGLDLDTDGKIPHPEPQEISDV